VTVKCPKCHSDNPDTQKFCGECAAPLTASEGIQPSFTKTLLTPVEDLPQGTLFANRYEIIEELGKGGMGRVYKALDNEIHEEVAIKLLKPEIAADEKIIERFRNELKIARKISHKNVCRTYHISKEEGTPYITMEYVEGEDLKSLVKKRGRVPKEEALGIARQVCEGLVEAHKLGVVHRDLKPQNIMIDEKGNAKIMDFGIARSVEAPGVTQTGVIIGTPDYISPEQAEGREADHRSDIYSMGVILYEMVTGTVPFKGDTALSVALKHKSQLPLDPRKFNPEVSDDLARLILICMEKDRGRRYQTAEALLDDLRNIEEGFPLGTKIRPRRETFAATLIRKKLFIPALVVALAIIAIAIWQLLLQPTPPLPTGRPSLAILYFENNSRDESLDNWKMGFSDLLIGDLSQSKFIDVLTQDRIYSVLKKLNLLDAPRYSTEDLVNVTKLTGATHTLTGSYIKAGEDLHITSVLQKPNTGEVIRSTLVKIKGEAEIMAGVDELTIEIKAGLDLSQEKIAGDIDRDTANIYTSFPEALKYYIEGHKYYISGDFTLSITFYEKAVSIDPEFARAYLEMADMYDVLGRSSKAKNLRLKAIEFLDRIPDRDRLKTLAYHKYMLVDRNFEKALETYAEYMELYPDDMKIHTGIGHTYRFLEEWDKALKHYLMRGTQPTSFYKFVQPANSYRRLGLYDKAIEVLEQGLNYFPDNDNMYHSLSLTYLSQGNCDQAHKEVDKAISLNPAQFRNRRMKGDIYLCEGDVLNAENEYKKLLDFEQEAAQLLGRQRLGELYLLQGQFTKSMDQAQKGIDLAAALEEMGWESQFYFGLAKAHLGSGNPEEALKVINSGLEGAVKAGDSDWQRTFLHLKGLVFIKRASLIEAQQVADELKTLTENDMNKKLIRDYYHLRGLLEAERGVHSKAIESFKQTISLLSSRFDLEGKPSPGPIESLASTYYKTGDLNKAGEQYERILSLTTSRIQDGDIYAKAFYMLGKIHERQGDTAKAVDHYEKFLTLWKDADPGIAEVEDARKRLVGLKSETKRD
jgi:serine/threonine protein kinase/tetratricopeptide (TPR) repeat protein